MGGPQTMHAFTGKGSRVSTVPFKWNHVYKALASQPLLTISYMHKATLEEST